MGELLDEILLGIRRLEKLIQVAPHLVGQENFGVLLLFFSQKKLSILEELLMGEIWCIDVVQCIPNVLIYNLRLS